MTTHPLHAPDEREVIATLTDGWEVRQFRTHDRRLSYFAKRGFAHVQLWHAGQRVSIVTPSRLTAGMFDAWQNGLRWSAPTWPALASVLAPAGITVLARHEARAIERWFVLPTESRAGRLLRSWWAGEATS